MTDVPLARAELKALIVQAKAGRAYAQTAVAAATSAENAFTAVITRAENAQEALESDGPPPELPVLRIDHAAPVAAGEELSFDVSLSEPSDVNVTVKWVCVTSGGNEVAKSTLLFGPQEDLRVLKIPTLPDVHTVYTVTLNEPQGATLGRATATGTILPPAPTGDLWERALFLHETPLTAVDGPIIFPPGELAGLKSVALVVKAAMSGKHEKFMGGPSSQSAGQGAFGIGVNPALDLDIWRAGGGQSNKMAGAPKLTAGQPTLLGVAWDGTIALGPPWQSQDLLLPLAVIDGPVYLGAGAWAGNHPIDLIQPGTEILAAAGWAEVLTAEQWAQVEARWAHLLVDDGGNGGGGNGGNGNGGNGGGSGGNPEHPVEAVDPRLHQVTLAVAPDAPTHVWQGAGTGLNTEAGAKAVFDRVKQAKGRLDRIGMHVLRIFSPQNRDRCVSGYKPYYDLFKPRLVVASGFVYRSGGSVRANIRALAEGVKYCWDHRLPIYIVTNQNEPDGNRANTPREGSMAEHHRWLRDDLDSLGLRHVKVATLEWRHPPNEGIPEFDQLKAAGLIGTGKAVTIGCGHVYDKTQGLDLADRLRGVGITWSSWETGNNGSGTSSLARELSAANLGSAFGCMHYVMITTATPNSEQMGQAFLDWNGKDRPWAGHWEVAFGKALVPESTIYRCSSSDRAPGMPTAMDTWMVRNAAASGGRNPRLNVVVARRKDGQTAIVATNTTSGSDAFNPYTSGHYGDLDQQHTLRVPWLVGKDGSFQVWRANPEGGVVGPQVVGMDNGLVRWALQGGWSAGLVGGSA